MKGSVRFQSAHLLLMLTLLLGAFAAARAETVLYSFTGALGDGKYPMAPLIFDKTGTAYGTTTAGGDYGAGTVFKLTPPATKGGVWTETVLYNFQGTSDGATPYYGVIRDSAGNLYGETVGGGTGTCFYQNITGCGVVYKLTPPSTSGGNWTQSVLYAFTGGADGGDPLGNLVFGKPGVLYGTTILGGKLAGGTVFELHQSQGGVWKERVIHSFGGSGDGAQPGSGVVLDKSGNLWGTTAGGGQFLFWGTLFMLRPLQGGLWGETVLYSFTNGMDGGSPVASPIFDKAGNLYGTTFGGGSSSNGTVYTLTHQGGTWTESVLYSFQGGNDGRLPQGPLIFDGTGNLYGTTQGGGRPNAGTVFKLSPPGTQGGTWTENVLYSFTIGADGGLPYAGLVFGPGGALYGTTFVGGSSFVGTVYGVKP